ENDTGCAVAVAGQVPQCVAGARPQAGLGTLLTPGRSTPSARCRSLARHDHPPADWLDARRLERELSSSRSSDWLRRVFVDSSRAESPRCALELDSLSRESCRGPLELCRDELSRSSDDARPWSLLRSPPLVDCDRDGGGVAGLAACGSPISFFLPIGVTRIRAGSPEGTMPS